MTERDVLREFVADCEAAFPAFDGSPEFVAAAISDEWPDLASTYLHAKDVLQQRQIPRGVFVVAMQRAFDMGSRHENHLLKDLPWDLERAAQIWEDYKQLVEATYKRLNGEQA
jgi:hypothetical protein